MNAVMLAAVLLLCAWATRGLEAMSLKLWAAWAVVTPGVHQLVLELVARWWTHWASRRPVPAAVVVGSGPVGVAGDAARWGAADGGRARHRGPTS